MPFFVIFQFLGRAQIISTAPRVRQAGSDLLKIQADSKCYITSRQIALEKEGPKRGIFFSRVKVS